MTAWGTLFPLTISNWTANVRYNTQIVEGQSGYESRNALWQDPLYSYNAAFAVRTYADIATLQAFFHSMKGREGSFLVKDYADFQIARQTIGTGNGVATTFQLIKTYVQAVSDDYVRTITKPKAVEGTGGVSVWVNNSAVSAANYSFSSSTGIITISSPSPVPNGHVVEASCDEFYVPCRFDIDELPVQLLNYWVESGADFANVNIPDIPLREVRGE